VNTEDTCCAHYIGKKQVCLLSFWMRFPLVYCTDLVDSRILFASDLEFGLLRSDWLHGDVFSSRSSI
jgi:hypothetical protein